MDELGRLDGVRQVERTGSLVTVQGDRCIIAHVGASLVRRGMVPRDLGVHVPDLEDALLTLLEPGAPETTAPPRADNELVGGRR
jgi:hypothetical protein